MSLPPGTKVGPYELLAPISVDATGELYRALNTNLNRVVGLRVLAPSLVSNTERMADVRQAVHILSSLNHPHIGRIHDCETIDDTTALIVELVEGPSLADRIAQGAIPLDEALPFAKQLAESLEHVHGRGVVHGRLTPASITLLAGGVRVAGFGLAPTSDSVNERRADIRAFGVVLYEMLTGRPPFAADTASIPQIQEPRWDGLPRNEPLLRLLRRTLAHDPSQRLRDAGDIVLELDEAMKLKVSRKSPRATPSFEAVIAILGVVVAVVAIVPPTLQSYLEAKTNKIARIRDYGFRLVTTKDDQEAGMLARFIAEEGTDALPGLLAVVDSGNVAQSVTVADAAWKGIEAIGRDGLPETCRAVASVIGDGSSDFVWRTHVDALKHVHTLSCREACPRVKKYTAALSTFETWKTTHVKDEVTLADVQNFIEPALADLKTLCP